MPICCFAIQGGEPEKGSPPWMIGDFNDFNDLNDFKDFKDFNVVKVPISLTLPAVFSCPDIGCRLPQNRSARANYVKILIIRTRDFVTFSLSRTGKAKIYFCFATARKGRRKFNILLENKRKFDSN